MNVKTLERAKLILEKAHHALTEGCLNLPREAYEFLIEQREFLRDVVKYEPAEELSNFWPPPSHRLVDATRPARVLHAIELIPAIVAGYVAQAGTKGAVSDAIYLNSLAHNMANAFNDPEGFLNMIAPTENPPGDKVQS